MSKETIVAAQVAERARVSSVMVVILSTFPTLHSPQRLLSSAAIARWPIAIGYMDRVHAIVADKLCNN